MYVPVCCSTVFAATHTGQVVGNMRENLWQRILADYPALVWRVDMADNAKVSSRRTEG